MRLDSKFSYKMENRVIVASSVLLHRHMSIHDMSERVFFIVDV